MKFSVVPTFAAVATMSWPDPVTPGAFRSFKFECRFKAVSNDPDERESLQKKQDEQGMFAFLDVVLDSVKLPENIEPVDENDAPMAPIDWVKRNQIAERILGLPRDPLIR